MSLIEDGLKLAVGDYKSSFVNVLLFLLRIATKALTFLKDVCKSGTSNENETLKKYDNHFSDWIERAVAMATKWLKESEKAGSKKESTIFRAHIAMTVWPASPLDTEMASRLLSMLPS